MFQIALRNVKRNFYNYFIYFLSMVFNVIIYFIFQSIQYNDQIEKMVGGSKKISSAFHAASVILIIFITIFIWYSNSFFIKKRKREVALYSMMGVKKKQIGRMLFYETISMGALALLIGIILGSIFSKLFSDLLIKIMGISAIINFSISSKAIYATILVFAIIFIVASLHGYSLTYRFQLIELFKAENKGEKPPKASIVSAILAIVFISVGYYTSVNMFEPKFFVSSFGLRVGVLFGSIIIGTYLLIKNFTTLIVKIYKKNKARYYKGINMIGVSQLQYRFKSNARTLTIIALLSATTLTSVGLSYSLYYMNEKGGRDSAPFDLQYVYNKTDYENIISAVGEDKIKNNFKLELLRTPVVFKGEKPPQKLYEKEEDILYLISESKYNKIMTELNKDEYTVKIKNKDESVLLDSTQSKILKGDYENTKYMLYPDNEDYELNVIGRKNIDLTNVGIAGLLAVVSDETYDSFYKKENLFEITSIMLKNPKDATISTSIKGILNEEQKEKIKFVSYYDYYNAGIASSGLMLFVTGFLGLIFLISTGSIIYFKQLTEANEEKGRYEILRKVGVSEKEIKKTISRQMLLVFLLPLILGISHASFAVSLFSTIIGFNFMIPALISFAAYIAIYVIYYIVTVREYYNIVSKNS
ncbi:FtsX-like permease family protein [Clostridium uliginosum]|nr:ABC transporter permease [Clostridium uliginosum]